MGPAGMRLPEVWRRAEQQRKKPWRIAAVFGPVLLLGYLLRRLTLDEAMARISARLGVRVAAVTMPMAEAAIDVDKAEDLLLAGEILRNQGQAGSPGRSARSIRRARREPGGPPREGPR